MSPVFHHPQFHCQCSFLDQESPLHLRIPEFQKTNKLDEYQFTVKCTTFRPKKTSFATTPSLWQLTSGGRDSSRCGNKASGCCIRLNSISSTRPRLCCWRGSDLHEKNITGQLHKCLLISATAKTNKMIKHTTRRKICLLTLNNKPHSL